MNKTLLMKILVGAVSAALPLTGAVNFTDYNDANNNIAAENSTYVGEANNAEGLENNYDWLAAAEKTEEAATEKTEETSAAEDVVTEQVTDGKSTVVVSDNKTQGMTETVETEDDENEVVRADTVVDVVTIHIPPAKKDEPVEEKQPVYIEIHDCNCGWSTTNYEELKEHMFNHALKGEVYSYHTEVIKQ